MNELKTTRKFNKNADVKLIDKREVVTFSNEEFGSVRVLEVNNEPWFIGKDVAKVLGYVKSRNAISKYVDEDDALKQGVTDSLGRMQETTLINESGLYSLILSSKLPTAKKFKRWVTSEVLPTIRKTGGMVVENREEEFINNYFPSFSEEVKLAMVQDLRQQNTLLKQKVEEQRPKVEYHDKVLNSDKLITTTDVAKDLGMSARKLHTALHEKGIIYRQGTNWKLYAKYEDRVPTYCDYVINEYSQQLKWTEKGRKWIIDVLA